MNTIPTTAFANTIVAIDLGKYKSVVCIHDQGNGEIRFTTLDTSRGELAKLLAKEKAGVVFIEACLLAGWVHDLCADLGVPCLVANTASEAWKFKHLKRKTDKDEALRLAQLARLEAGRVMEIRRHGLRSAGPKTRRRLKQLHVRCAPRSGVIVHGAFLQVEGDIKRVGRSAMVVVRIRLPTPWFSVEELAATPSALLAELVQACLSLGD